MTRREDGIRMDLRVRGGGGEVGSEGIFKEESENTVYLVIFLQFGTILQPPR